MPCSSTPTPSGEMMYTATIQVGSGPRGLAHARGARHCLHDAIHYAVLSGGGIPNTYLILEGRMEAVLHGGGGWDAAP